MIPVKETAINNFILNAVSDKRKNKHAYRNNITKNLMINFLNGIIFDIEVCRILAECHK